METDGGSLRRSVGREYRAKKDLEKELHQLMTKIQIPNPTWNQLREYLEVQYPEYLDMIDNPPPWISELSRQMWEAEDAADAKADTDAQVRVAADPEASTDARVTDPEASADAQVAAGTEGAVGAKSKALKQWTKVLKNGKKQAIDRQVARTFYEFWKSGHDIYFIQPPLNSQASVQTKAQGKNKREKSRPVVLGHTKKDVKKRNLEYRQRTFLFFEPLGLGTNIPETPTGNRTSQQLLNTTPPLWSMSLTERVLLATHWIDEMRSVAYQSHLGDYQAIRLEYDDACARFNDVKDEVRFGSSF